MWVPRWGHGAVSGHLLRRAGPIELHAILHPRIPNGCAGWRFAHKTKDHERNKCHRRPRGVAADLFSSGRGRSDDYDRDHAVQ